MTNGNSPIVETRLAVMETNIEHIQKDIAEIKRMLANNYITKAEFDPVRRIVYGGVSLVLVAVFTAIIALVLTGGTP